MVRSLFAALILSVSAFAGEVPDSHGDTGSAGLSEEGGLGQGVGLVDPIPSILDLETAKAIALRNNPSMKAAAARVDQAKARVRQARSAYFPTVGATGSVSKTWIDENTYRTAKRQAFVGSLQGGTAGGSASVAQSTLPVLTALGSAANAFDAAIRARDRVEDDFTTYSAALTIQWLLFDGFAREFNHAAAKFGAKELEAADLEARRLLLDAVAGAYYAAALAREDVTIAKADEVFNLRQLKEAQARRRVGTGSLSDELNFEVRVNTARASLIRGERSYAVAMLGLAELLGMPEGKFSQNVELAPLTEEDPEELTSPDVLACVERALELRPDLRQRRHAAGRAKAEMKAGRGVFYPSVSASATRSATLQGDNDIGQDDFATTVGLNVSYSIFAGGRNRARYVETKAARLEAEHNADSAEIAVRADVRSAAELLMEAQKQLWLQRANAVFVQKNRDLVEKEYRAGQASLVRLNEAQRDLTSAQGQLALARVTLRQAWHSLKTATAETLAPFEGTE